MASIDGNKVQVTLVDEKAGWMKKGAGVKFGELKGRPPGSATPHSRSLRRRPPS
jgi:hypothetical protein